MTAQTKSYIHVAIMLLLSFGVGFLPPFGEITEVGMKVLGVFLGTLYGWIFVDIFWASLFGFISLSFTGTIGLLAALTQCFGNVVFIMMVFIAIFAESINQLGVTNFIAHWLLSQKTLIGKPWTLINAMAIVVFITTALGPGMATMFLVWSVIVTIAEINGYGSQHKVISMGITFTVFAMMIGSIVVPFQTNFILYNGFFTQQLGGTGVPGMTHMILTLIYYIGVSVLFVLACKYILKIDTSRFTSNEELCEQFAKTKPTKVQKIGLILLVAYFTLLILATLFPTAPVLSTVSALGPVGMGIIYMSVFVVWRNAENKPQLNLAACFNKGIPWAVAILYGVTIPLINIMETPEVGVMATVSNFVVPILSNFDATTLMIISAIALAIITQFSHNLVLVAMFTPIIVPVIMATGGNAYTMCWIMFMVLNCAIATPAGSAYAGYLYGHPNVPAKDGYLFGSLLMIISLIITLIMIPLANMLF